MAEQEPPVFCIDMGTTRTRVWLVEGDTIYAHKVADFGARDSAARHDRLWLYERLVNIINETYQSAEAAVPYPKYAVAAGMITSVQGPLEVPHIEAPTGAREIAMGMRAANLAQCPALTILLVPGIRTGARQASLDEVSATDLMRGEETLCIGLLESAMLGSNTILLTLGSHWKWISVDADLRIAGSRTTLTGEMIHAIQSNTLLAASLFDRQPQMFDLEWIKRGLREARAHGLGRALFCVRLLDVHGHGTPEQRLAFLYGAFLAEELKSAKDLIGGDLQVLISGPAALAAVWHECLQEMGIPSSTLEESVRESAYLKGLRVLSMANKLLV